MAMGMGGDDDLSDETMVREMRRRILEQIRHAGGGGGQAQSITNNVYGGAVPGGGGGGVREQAGGDMPMPQDDRDYFVDIMREDLPEINEATGKPKGWKKTVHRFTTARNDDPKKKS